MTILITAPYHAAGLSVLKAQFGDVVYRPWKVHGRAWNEAELMQMLADTQADALITEHDQVTAAVVRSRFLQFIGVCRGTPSNVAVAAATELGIPVFHTPARNAQAVAEMLLSNVILLLRRTLPAMNWLKNRQWQAGAHDSYLQFKGNELAGRTIGIAGFGAIGQLIAKLVQPYPCNIQFYDPFVIEHDVAYRKTTLTELFATSDIVSIHLPATTDTKGMINGNLLNSMKADAIFINTARAAVVDRTDLLHVLENNTIRGAVLDVFDHEPPDALDYRLIDHPHVIATPHIAGATHEVEDHHVAIMNKALHEWFVLGNRQISSLCNKAILQQIIS